MPNKKILSVVTGAAGYMAVGALAETTENRLMGAMLGLGKYGATKLT